MRAKAKDVEIEYEVFGEKKNPVILLIMGLASQLTRWPIPFCEMLVARGFYVIRYDNRDIGLSTQFQGIEVPTPIELMMEMMAGNKPAVPYTLSDMASDAIQVLDAEGIEKAHIVGASMGGMIAQLVAATYPSRTSSLTSIMSSTGNLSLPLSTPEAMAFLTTPAPDPNVDFEAYIAHLVSGQRIIGSPAYPPVEEEQRQKILADFRRSYNPQGIVRQMAAVVADGDRRERLKTIRVPVVVVHGDADPLVPLTGGKDTAENIPGAELRVIPGMGHDMPKALYTTIGDAIERAVERSKS